MKKFISASLCLILLFSALSLNTLAADVFDIYVNVSGNGTLGFSQLENIPAGQKVTVVVMPEEGYRLKSGTLKYSNLEMTMDAAGNYNFTMPTADVTVTAAFEEIPVETTWDKIVKLAKSLGGPLKDIGKSLLNLIKAVATELVSGVKGAIGK